MGGINFKGKTFGVFLTALAVVSTIGCSNSEDASVIPDPKTTISKCLENGALGNIEQNHGHTLTIPKEDIAAAKQKTYTIQGSAEHSHTLTVTSQDFTNMKNVNALKIVDIYSSTENDHRHSVIIFCAP